MEPLYVIAVLIMAVIILAGFLYTLRKISFVEARLEEIKVQVQEVNEGISRTRSNMSMGLDRLAVSSFRQIEALYSVYLDLGLKRSLPPTRGWAASPDLLRHLTMYALQAKPEFIVECGSGVSTLVLARCAQLNGAGHVCSLEHSLDTVQQVRRNLAHHELSEFATVLHAPLQQYELGGQTWSWYSLEGLPETGIDMLFVDGPPGATQALARYPAGPFLLNRLTPGAAAFLDDAGRSDEKQISQRWLQEFPGLKQGFLESEKGCAYFWKVLEVSDAATTTEGPESQ